MATDELIAVLVADYDSPNCDAIDLELLLPWKCEARDAETGKELGAFEAGKCTLRVPLSGHRSSVVTLRRSR
jgi:hypothetical protein